MTDELILFTCPKCKRSLVWAKETANVYCKHCDRWIKVKDMTEINPPKMDPKGNQMVLF